jgi:hypothetical protein
MSMVSFNSADDLCGPLFKLYTHAFNYRMLCAKDEDIVPDTYGYAAVKEFDEGLSETYALYVFTKIGVYCV